MTCPLLSATPDIISLSSQAEFLLHWLMPARARIQQQRKIPTPLSRDLPLWRSWQRMGIELAPHHCLLMIRRAGQAWRGMSAAIIYSLPRSSSRTQEELGHRGVREEQQPLSPPGPGLCLQPGSCIVWSPDTLICCFICSIDIPFIAHTLFIRHLNLDNERNA